MSTLGDMLKYLPPRLAEAIAEECGRLGADDGAGAGQHCFVTELRLRRELPCSLTLSDAADIGAAKRTVCGACAHDRKFAAYTRGCAPSGLYPSAGRLARRCVRQGGRALAVRLGGRHRRDKFDVYSHLASGLRRVGRDIRASAVAAL